MITAKEARAKAENARMQRELSTVAEVVNEEIEKGKFMAHVAFVIHDATKKQLEEKFDYSIEYPYNGGTDINW